MTKIYRSKSSFSFVMKQLRRERSWTPFEDKQLLEMTETKMTALEIAHKLHRTIAAIYTRKHRLLGTKKPRRVNVPDRNIKRFSERRLSK